jgi:hypothetical protein
MPYDKWITLKKMLYQVGFAALSAGVTVGINFLQALPAEENTAIFVITLAGLQGLQNYIAHRNDK